MYEALGAFEKKNMNIVTSDKSSITLLYKKKEVVYYPLSQWATGGSIKDGRGLDNLLKQLKYY